MVSSRNVNNWSIVTAFRQFFLTILDSKISRLVVREIDCQICDFQTALLEEISSVRTRVLNTLKSGFFWHLNKIVSPVTVL